MKKKNKYNSPKVSKRQEWKDEIENEAITLQDDIDNAFEGMEVDKSIIEMVEKAIKDFKERANDAIEQFTINEEMVFDTDELLYNCLWQIDLGKHIASDSEINEMIDITSKNGTFIQADSMIEQMRIDEFVAELKENPYQLKLIA